MSTSTCIEPIRREALALLAASLIVACGGSPGAPNEPVPSKVFAVGERISFADIPAGYYVDSEENRSVDPNDAFMQAFRDRKAADLRDPDAPRPFDQSQRTTPPELEASTEAWDDVETELRFDWEALRATASADVDSLERTVKVRRILDHPDLRIVELAIGGRGLLPLHSQPGPAVFHVLEGDAEVVVGERAARVFPGTSIKLEAGAARKITVLSDAPLKILWLSWAPGGDQHYLSTGYYMTGSNFHAQPVEARMPSDFQIWNGSSRRRHEEPSIEDGEPSPTRSSAASDAYPATPLFSDELDVEWLDFTNIATAGFFWAADAAAAADLLSAWNDIARMKGIFQAKVAGAHYDLNFSYIAIGPGGKYVTHSHATPEFYYVLGGDTQWLLDGSEYWARPGDIYFHGPYEDHEMLVTSPDQPLRAITGSWAPFGDRSVFVEPFVLLEALPAQPQASSLPDDFAFHDFDLQQGLIFGTAP